MKINVVLETVERIAAFWIHTPAHQVWGDALISGLIL